MVMHCLPAYRGKEIDDATFESHASTIFNQAENRLHAQKAVLDWIVDDKVSWKEKSQAPFFGRQSVPQHAQQLIGGEGFG